MLVWYCKNCEAKEPVEDTGDPESDYVEGDTEKCIDCGSFCKVYDEDTLKEILEDEAREKEDA